MNFTSGNQQNAINGFQKNNTYTQPGQLNVQNQYQTNRKSPQPNNKVDSPEKPNYPSASDLLDSVMSESEKNQSKNNSPENLNQGIESKYRSNVQVQLFEKGNIWTTTSNVQTQKKTEFDAFWQFSSNVNTMANMNKKQDFKTEGSFNKQAFDFAPPKKPIQNQKPG